MTEQPAARYHFLRSSRWVGLIVFALVASVITVFLGMWQWDRHHAKADRVERIVANWDAPAVGIDDVLARGLAVTTADEWRQVELTGEFLPTTVAIRNRPMNSRPALLPTGIFLADREGGQVAVVVNLGWVPAEDAIPGVPVGRQNLLVRLRLDEEPSARQAPEFQTHAFNTAQVVAASGMAERLMAVPVLQGWSQVLEADAPLEAMPDPDRSLGNHLSYALQWWFFAAAIPVGVMLLARREARDEFEMAVAGVGVPRRRGPTDEEIEDEQVAGQASATRSM